MSINISIIFLSIACLALSISLFIITKELRNLKRTLNYYKNKSFQEH